MLLLVGFGHRRNGSELRRKWHHEVAEPDNEETHQEILKLGPQNSSAEEALCVGFCRFREKADACYKSPLQSVQLLKLAEDHYKNRLATLCAGLISERSSEKPRVENEALKGVVPMSSGSCSCG